MTDKIQKKIVTPVDGSEEALRALDYLNLCFTTAHNLNVVLFYVLPSLPPMLVDECKKSQSAREKLRQFEEKNIKMAGKILSTAKERLLEKGFAENRIETVYRKKEVDTARDICNWAESKRVDALLLNTRGRSRLEAFFMGETARKVLESAKVCPVWLIKGSVQSRRVLLAMDSSVNAVRAADHAGFMLAGTDCTVTLFHSRRNLQRYIPKELFEDAAELEDLWKHTAGQDIAPYLEEAMEHLLAAGLDEKQIKIKIADGSRSPAADILAEARQGEYGTIIMGRKGRSSLQEFFMGSVTSKVLENYDDMALWIVK